MSDTVIRVENLGKKYIIGHQQQPYKTLRDVMANGVRSLRHQLLKPFGKSGPNSAYEEFWALKDISFEIKPGEVVGIIGRNGAGKSTLLKILSRITEPTNGRISIKGRVASLLEVGTGFHPELTGRENIYLNGAILGMSKAEIKKKFDEIVTFAEVERFLDTPVKRYSSGMYVRLAFAVAAHLEPEILVVDEVLAVGDSQFQKKCLGKMEDVAQAGRTVIFVSHNMSAIEALCNRGILLQQGSLHFDGIVHQSIQRYLEEAYAGIKNISLVGRKDRKGSGKARFSQLRVLDSSNSEVLSLQSGKNYCFEIQYLNNTNINLKDVIAGVAIYDEHNTRVLLFKNNFTSHELVLDKEGGCISCYIESLPLANGLYRLALSLASKDNGETFDHIQDAGTLTVDGGNFFGNGSQGEPMFCKILMKAQWFSNSTLI